MKQRVKSKNVIKLAIAISIIMIFVLLSVITIKKSSTKYSILTTTMESDTIIYTTIKGNISLSSNKNATVELYNDDNNMIESIQVNDNGDYAFTLESEDSYYIKVKQPGYLDFQTTPIEIFYGYNIKMQNIEMKFGDLNGDSEIEIQDLTIINDNFKVLLENETSICDSNNDGKIDEQDRENLKINYGYSNTIDYVEYSISYTITYNANGGTNAPENQFKENGIDLELSTNVPAQENKTFIGWGTTSEAVIAEYIAGDIYQVNEPVQLYAIWENTQYNILYNMNGGTNTNYNPSIYTSFDENINLIQPSKDGYDFVGWTGSNGDTPELDVTIPTGSSGDKEFNAIWNPKSGIQYKVEYYTQNLENSEYTLSEIQELQGNTDELVSAPYLEIEGFTFDSMNENNITEGNVLPDGTLVLKLYYSRLSYQLTAVAGNNTSVTSGSGIYKYGAEVSIDVVLLEEEGYNYIFEKWASNNTEKLANSTTKLYTFTMPVVNIEITATAIKMADTDIIYKVEHYKESLTTDTYNLAETETFSGKTGDIVTATQKTYTGFTYNLNNTHNVISGEILGDGSLVLKLYYTRNSYALTTTAGTYISSVTGGGTYKYGQSVSITSTLASATGYTYSFSKWTSSDTSAVANSTTKNTTIIMPAKNVTMTASATRTAITYTISYTLNSGTVSGTNPSTYTVATSAITLINPTRTGYTFKGWTGSNGTTASTSVTIAKGSTGNKTYTANWTDNINPSSPTLTVTSGTSGNNGWYKSNVVVKITAGTDSGSGVSKTTYVLSGATTKAETTITSGNTITISAEGSTVIKAYTYDKSGNVSAVKSLTVKKDTVAPVINLNKATFSGAIFNSTTAQITANGYGTDATSGISSYSYYNGTAWQTSNVIPATSTTTKFRFRVYDKAGNVSYTDTYSNFNRFMFITQIYENLLGRTPCMSDVYYWATTRYVELGNEGYSGKQMQIIGIEMGISDEANALTNTKFIEGLYLAYFGRDYESSSTKSSVTTKLTSGTYDRRGLIAYLLKSTEFTTTCTKWGFTYSTSIQ